MDLIVLIIVVSGYTALVYAVSWSRGHRKGVEDGIKVGFNRYARQLRFERREDAIIEPTDQPHSRRPKGRARVTDAHMSQVRRQWLEPGS